MSAEPVAPETATPGSSADVVDDRDPAAKSAPPPTAFVRPLSILMLAPCPFPTSQGTQIVIRHLATELARAGNDVHLVTYGYGEPGSDYPFHLHRAPRVDAGFRAGPSLLKPAADAALLLAATRVARAHRCDVIHAHNVEGLALGALLKLQTNLPLVYHAHNAMGPELPTYFRAHLAQAFAAFVGDVLDRTLPRAADAIVVFDTDHAAFHAAYGVEPERLHVIPPGLDAAELRAPAPEVTAAVAADLGPGPWLLYAGNPDGYQNLPLLWAAMAELRGRVAGLRLLVVAQHDPALFRPGVKAAGVTDLVRFVQPRHLEELRAYFHLADVGVCPRTLWTGAPIKVLNYLAAGLPVVACRTGARHVVGPGAGKLVEDAPAAFAQGILEILESAAAAPRDRSERRAFERFHIARHMPLYEAMYARARRARARPPEED